MAAESLTSWHCFNRLLGFLHHCLTTRTDYGETTAFPPPETPEIDAAA